MKQVYIILCMIVICFVPISAQLTPIEDYLQQASYHAEIYNGKVEEVYNSLIYKELPYYKNADFTESSIVYKGNYYPLQKARLDLFREQLVILSPENRTIVLAPSNVEKAYMYGKTFVWLMPPKNSRLTSGYYMQLFDEKKIQLFCKEKYAPRKSLLNNYVVFYFDYGIRYYLLYNNRYYTVKNKSSFSKLFPQHKKQINQFVKEHPLDFKRNADESLTALAAYCEKLISSTNLIETKNIHSEQLLQNEFTDFPYNVSSYNDSLLILKGEELGIKLSPVFTTKAQPQDTIIENIENEIQTEKIEKTGFVNSENLVYSVGNPYLKNILDEVTVVAQRTDNVKSIQLGTEKLQIPKIKNIPTAFGEVDILRVIQSLPGVKTVGEASTGYNVRGGATDQNLILLNNGTIYNPNHLFGLFTAFNSDMVKEVELYKSSIPAQYGGRISSVLDVTGKEASKEKFNGSAGLGLVTSKLNLEIPVIKDRTSVLLSGRTTYSDWILKQLPEKSGYNKGTAGFYDLGTVISHQVDAKNALNVYGYYSRDRFEFNENQKYAYNNLNASAKWKHLYNEKLMGNFAAGYDHYGYENTDSTNELAAYKLSFKIDQFFAKANFIYDLHFHQINFGLKSMLYDVSPGNYEPFGTNSIVKLNKLQKENALESALYAEDQWDITHKLSLTAGIHFSIFNALGARTYYKYDPDMLPYESTIIDTLHASAGQVFKTYMGPEFRLAARYILADNFSVKAGFNTMRQYIHKLSNTVIMSPTDTWKLSDANIRPQKGWQAATGLYYNTPGKNWLCSMEVYYKKMSDYLDYRSGAQILMNHHIETDAISTEGYAYGVEWSLKKEVGKLNGWASYTYSRTFLRQSDKLIIRPVNNGNWYPTDYDKPHDFKLNGNYKFTQRYSCSLNIDYSTGRPTTIPAGKYYDPTLNTIQVFYSDRNSHRIPDYFRMDLSFNIEPSHKLTLLTHSSISFGVYNLTGRQNVYSIYYVSENGQVKGYKLSIFGVPIPFITYNIRF